MIWENVLKHIPYRFPGGSAGKESACNAGDLGLILGSGRSPGEGNSLPTSVFWPGEFHGQRSLVGYSPYSRRVRHDWATFPFIYITICKVDDQCVFDAWSRVPKASALGQLRRTGWGGKWRGGSGCGEHVYIWLIHVNVWQGPSHCCNYPPNK